MAGIFDSIFGSGNNSGAGGTTQATQATTATPATPAEPAEPASRTARRLEADDGRPAGIWRHRG